MSTDAPTLFRARFDEGSSVHLAGPEDLTLCRTRIGKPFGPHERPDALCPVCARLARGDDETRVRGPRSGSLAGPLLPAQRAES